MHYFPISLNINAKNIVFAGGNTSASSKVRLFLASKASITVIAPKLNTDLQYHYQRDKIRWIKTQPSPDNIATYLSDCSVFYAATGDKELDTALATIAKAHVKLVNAVDQPHLADFITPAYIDHHPISIAISTQGTAPVLARLLKAQIETMFPKKLGPLADLAGNLRSEIEAYFPDISQRQQFWQWFFLTALSPQGKNLQQPIHVQNLIKAFETSANYPKKSGLYFLPEENITDPESLTQLRYSDKIYYQCQSPCDDLIALARREADFFPNLLPDAQALVNAKKQHQTYFVIATLQALPFLAQSANHAKLPFYYLGKTPQFSLQITSKIELKGINWAYLYAENALKGTIILPRHLFPTLQKLLLNANCPEYTQLYVLSGCKLYTTDLKNLEKSHPTATQILFDFSAHLAKIEPEVEWEITGKKC